MDTYKPFSTIGYNTESFLKNRLDELKNQYPDLFWCYIYHRNEKDKKDHYHLYVEPNARIRNEDFVMIRKNFEEEDPDNEKPLSCMPFRKSNSFKDWYLYAVHDSNYLKAKHLVKSTYDYDPDLVIASDRSMLDDYTGEIDSIEYLSAVDKMFFCFESDMTMYEAMSYLRIPYSAMYGFMKLWQNMQKDRYLQKEPEASEPKNFRKATKAEQLRLEDLDPDELPF